MHVHVLLKHIKIPMSALLGKRFAPISPDESDQRTTDDETAEFAAMLDALQRNISSSAVPVPITQTNATRAAAAMLLVGGTTAADEEAVQRRRQALLLLGISTTAIQAMEFVSQQTRLIPSWSRSWCRRHPRSRLHPRSRPQPRRPRRSVNTRHH